MTSRPEYLRFVDVDVGKRKTRVVEVRSLSSDVLLGHIAWFGRWRQYTFSPEPHTTFNRDCLRTIDGQILVMMDGWRATKRNEREARARG